MAYTLDIPSDLDARLSAQAAQAGLSLQDYILLILSSSAADEQPDRYTYNLTDLSHNSQPSPDERAPFVITMVEIVHSLFERTHALGAAAQQLMGQPIQSSDYKSFHTNRSKMISSDHQKADRLAILLEYVLREVDLYRSYLANLLGALDSKSFLPISKVQVDLFSLVHEVIDLFAFMASQKGVEIDLQGESIVIKVDYDLTRRLVINLVDNAIKYSYSSARHTERRFIAVHVRRHNPQGDAKVRLVSNLMESEFLKRNSPLDLFFSMVSEVVSPWIEIVAVQE